MGSLFSVRTPDPVIYIIEPFGGSVRRHNHNLPHVYFDDAALTRGDAAYESILIREGKPINLQRHLARFAGSARGLGLPPVNEDQWGEATRQAAAEWQRANEGVEAACAWILSRGRQATGLATAWLVVRPVSPTALAQRDTGVRVMTTSRGWLLDSHLPEWYPAGVKSANYLASMAAVRHAHERGFDDVLFVENDSRRVLEAATATLMTVTTSGKLRTPTPGVDILTGTTQAAVFAAAAAEGWRCKEKELFYDDLLAADSVWLLSSTRLAVRVVRLDDHELPPGSRDDEVRALVEQALGA